MPYSSIYSVSSILLCTIKYWNCNTLLWFFSKGIVPNTKHIITGFHRDSRVGTNVFLVLSKKAFLHWSFFYDVCFKLFISSLSICVSTVGSSFLLNWQFQLCWHPIDFHVYLASVCYSWDKVSTVGSSLESAVKVSFSVLNMNFSELPNTKDL